MVKYTEEYETLKVVLSQLHKVYPGKFTWKTNNSLSYTNNKKVEGTITIDNLKVEITGDEIIKLYDKIRNFYLDVSKNKMTDVELQSTPLKVIISNRNEYNDIESNPIVINKILKEFKKFNIDTIHGRNKYLNQTDTISNNVSLCFAPQPNDHYESLESGYKNRLKTHLYAAKYCNNYSKKSDMNLNDAYKYKLMVGESHIEILDNGMLIGHYYPERNMIMLYFNPFGISKVSVFDTDMPLIFTRLFTIFKELGIKKNDISNIQEKIFITSFMSDANHKLDSAKENLESCKSQITKYEHSLRSCIADYQSNLTDVAYLKNLIESNGKGLYDEVKKINKLKFIKSVNISGGKIDILFKSKFIDIPNMMRHDCGKEFGKRHIWIGEVGFKISASDFRVYGNVNMGGHCHPHGNSFPIGDPCFGSGDGKNKIYNLLAQNKFGDLVKMLWFWIQTYRNAGAYIKVWNSYDSLLAQGYPIFDEKGVRVTLNDPVRIKTGEQIKLEKKDNYDNNIKHFKDMKYA